jgi:hypothetical protein
MSKAKYNQFTQGMLLAFSVLMLSVVLYMGKAFALKPSAPKTLAQFQPLPSLRADGLHRVALLPTLVSLHSSLPAGAMTLTHYSVDAHIQGNEAVTTITKTYKIAACHGQVGRSWLSNHLRASVPTFTFSVNGKPLLGPQVLSAKTG